MRITKLATIALFVLSMAIPAYAGTLDDFYLRQFREILPIPSDPVQSATPPKARCGMPLKRDLKKDWNNLEPETQKVLAKQLSAPSLPNETTLSSTAGHFVVHYSTSGTNAPTPNFPYTATSWARLVGDTFEQAYSTYKNTYGFISPPGNQYHVYLLDLAPRYLYGVTTTSTAAPSAGFPYAYGSYIEIDKDFTDPIFTRSGTSITYTPLQNLQVTAAHEFQHAIQFAYNVFSEAWYAEATATWYEALLYPSVLQNYEYVPDYFANSTKRLDLTVDQNAMDTGAGYGRWIFNRYLAEIYSPNLIRTVWENMANINPPADNSDIPMLPVINSAVASLGGNLSTDFLGFSKRVYLQHEWHLSEDRISKNLIYIPASPLYNKYPVNSSSTPQPLVFLERYSFAFYKFVPPANLPNNSMTITVNGTPAIEVRVFRKDAATKVITELAVSNTYPASATISNVSSASEIVLLLVNTSNNTTQNANFSTDGTFLPNAPVTSGAIPSNPNATPSFAKGAGGGGCFIATAAYGSYLHPQVQVLREFRDNWLLTNAPGRAFVSLYYRLSPPAADFVARHSALRIIVRLMLTPVVFAISNAIIVFLIVLVVTTGWMCRKMCLKTLQTDKP